MVCRCHDEYAMINASGVPPALKVSLLSTEGFFHQNVNVPGPVTVVCKVDVWEEVSPPLSAAETPSWVVVVSEDHPVEPKVPLVVQVRFVVLRAWASVCPRTTGGVITKAVIRASSPKHCAGFNATWESWLLVSLILCCILPDSA